MIFFFLQMFFSLAQPAPFDLSNPQFKFCVFHAPYLIDLIKF